jgi:hypothetical protein
VSTARVVLSGELWRVVAVELPNQHGVVELQYVVQLTDARDKEHYGVLTTWRELKDANAMGDHVKCWRYFLDELLKAAGEEPNVKKQPERKHQP